MLLTAFWAAIVAKKKKKVSVTMFCSSNISDVVLSLDNKTKCCQQPGVSEEPGNNERGNEAQILGAILLVCK